jgi:hypothetical protein
MSPRGLYNAQMDIKTIRARNTRLLAIEMGGLHALARRAGMSPAYLSQCTSLPPIRSVGESAARRLERSMGKLDGWLDEPREAEGEMPLDPSLDEKFKSIWERITKL